ncbi:MAG TPA: VOC family protein, partial [Acidimicrobiia bacterium]
MLTAVDHIVVGATDLDRLVDTFRRIGFTVTAKGDGPRLARAVFANCFLEFREVDALGSAEGLQRIVLRSDDLDAEVARLRASGVSVSEPIDEQVDLGGRSPISRRSDVDAVVPIGLVERDPDDMIAHLGDPTHPNTATSLERVYLAVDSIERELSPFARVVG